VSQDATVVEMPGGFLLSKRVIALDQKLDVVVFTDIGMDTPTTMWASARLAPIQVGSRYPLFIQPTSISSIIIITIIVAAAAVVTAAAAAACCCFLDCYMGSSYHYGLGKY